MNFRYQKKRLNLKYRFSRNNQQDATLYYSLLFHRSLKAEHDERYAAGKMLSLQRTVE
jgi:hypothetical protein